MNKGYTAKQRAWRNQQNQTAAAATTAPTPIAPVVAAPATAAKAVSKQKRQSKALKTLIVITVVIALATVVVLIWRFTRAPDQNTIPSETTAATTTEATAVTTASEAIITPLDAVINDMRQNGGGELGVNYVIGDDVNPELDTSTTGDGAFNPDGIRTPEAMVLWMQEKTTRGLAAISETQTNTEASESQIFETSYWLVMQSLVDGQLTGNTGFMDGDLVVLGNREIKAGDIFLVFVNPENLKIQYFRGACANPQGFTPQLDNPLPTPTPVPTKAPTPTPTAVPTPTPTPAPKSTNPADYKQPGDGKEKDSGTGTMPTSPKVTTPPEATPPSVDTKPTSKPYVAPSATPIPTQAPSATPTPVTVLANPWL